MRRRRLPSDRFGNEVRNHLVTLTLTQIEADKDDGYCLPASGKVADFRIPSAVLIFNHLEKIKAHYRYR